MLLRQPDLEKILKEIDEIYAAKGKKQVYVDLRKKKLDQETIDKFLLGPTGNFRAPAIRIGKVLMVGFNDDAYREFFGN